MEDGFARRAELYNAAFPEWPDSHFHGTGSRRYAVWMLGNDYRNRSRLYGAYPPNYLRRVMSMFPDVDPKRTLHLFSGSVKVGRSGAVTFDIARKLRPKVVGDAHALSMYFGPARFDLILADPPYSQDDADRYGTPMVNRPKVLHECYTVLRDGGHLVWLDTVWPMFTKREFSLVAAINVVRSTNHRVRDAFIFQRVSTDEKLPGG